MYVCAATLYETYNTRISILSQANVHFYLQVDAVDATGASALHIAVRQRNPLIVRLLRSYKADATILDSNGHVASFYCSEDDAAIRRELLDPALPYLMSAARNLRDVASRDTLERYTGLTGCLSTTSCVDVDAGDGWTPLMEAVVQGTRIYKAAGESVCLFVLACACVVFLHQHLLFIILTVGILGFGII